MRILSSLLQDRESFLTEIMEDTNLSPKMAGLCGICGVGFFLYGFIIGLSHSPLQALSSGIKLPILYLLTLAICIPTLHVFDSLFGSKRSLGKTATLLLTATSVISLILIGFAPISLFFLVTSDHYQFFKLLNVAIFCISGFIGMRFLYLAVRQFPEGEKQGQVTRLRFLRFWLLIYAFVGTQLGWCLRPFFGSPNMPFELVRALQGSFYTDILHSVGHVLGFH